MRPSEFKDFIGLLRTILGLEFTHPETSVDIVYLMSNEAIEKALAKYILKLSSPLKKKTIVTLSEMEIMAIIGADRDAIYETTFWICYNEIIEAIHIQYQMLKNHRENMKGNMRMKLEG